MGEEPSDAILLSIKPLLESTGPFRSGDAVSAGEEEEPFAALDLRDRVVVRLLREGVVNAGQVEAAWHQWKEDGEDTDTPDALWRVVARLPEVDAEAVFAQAARIYAFESAASILYRSRVLLREERGRFSLRQRRRLVALGVLPVKIDETPDGPRWIFATHDPARPAVHALLANLEVPAYELRYASAVAVRERLEDAFPGEIALEAHTSEGESPEQIPESPEDRGDPPAFLEAIFEEEAPDEKTGVPIEKTEVSGEVRRRRETARTFASIYEELLAGAARTDAARIRLAPDEGRRLTVTFDYDEQGEHRRVTLQVPPEAVLSFMRRRTRFTRRTASEAGRRVHRWVDERRHSFRIASLPDHSAWTAGQAEIVIDVVED